MNPRVYPRDVGFSLLTHFQKAPSLCCLSFKLLLCEGHVLPYTGFALNWLSVSGDTGVGVTKELACPLAFCFADEEGVLCRTV